MDASYTVVSDAALEVGSEVVGLPTVQIMNRDKAAMVTVGDVAVRFRIGAEPTASSGHRAPAGAVIEVYGREVGALRLISEGATSSCFVSFLRKS